MVCLQHYLYNGFEHENKGVFTLWLPTRDPSQSGFDPGPGLVKFAFTLHASSAGKSTRIDIVLRFDPEVNGHDGKIRMTCVACKHGDR